MKITSVEVIHVVAPLKVAAGPPGHFNAARESIFVKVVAESGFAGWGETYALPGVAATIKSFESLLIGSDPIASLGSWCPPWVATVAHPSGLAAIDIALHDLCGRILGVPVHVLLGGAKRGRVRAYASGLLYRDGAPAAEVWRSEAAELVQRGFTAIKLRIGGGPMLEEMEVLEELRSEVPDQVELMVDAWGAYSSTTALSAGRRLQEIGIAWFEEPLVPEPDHGGYAELARALDIPIAGGEMVRDRGVFKALFERSCFDIVQPDICICGGLRELLFVSELAELYGVTCIPHSWNGAVMNAATLHAASVIQARSRLETADAMLLEYDTSENPFMREIVVNPPLLVDGFFEVPSTPGLGVTLDEERLRTFAVAR